MGRKTKQKEGVEIMIDFPRKYQSTRESWWESHLGWENTQLLEYEKHNFDNQTNKSCK